MHDCHIPNPLVRKNNFKNRYFLREKFESGRAEAAEVRPYGLLPNEIFAPLKKFRFLFHLKM